jgi:restriction system protein
MTRRSFTAAVNRSIRAYEAQQRSRVREAAAQVRAHERAASAAAKATKQAYLGVRQTLADMKNEEVSSQIAAVSRLLATVLDAWQDVDLGQLRRVVDERTLNDRPELVVGPAPKEEDFLPARPGLLAGLLPGARAKHEAQAQAGRRRLEEALADRQARFAARQRALDQLKTEVAAHNVEVDQFGQSIGAGETDALATYAELLLEATPLPEGFPVNYRVALTETSMQLVVEFDMPRLDDVIPEDESYRYVKTSDSVVAKKRPAKARSALYVETLAQLTLALLSRLFRSERLHGIETAVLSGFVDTLDPSTGRRVRPCLISVRAVRDEIVGLDLRHVEPVACLKRLSAAVSRSPDELVAVKPVVDFNMVDPRFVSEQDVLSTLDTRPNLMELTPGEFESLITNLFQKMGLDTKLTQASRDGGVDCVAFDPRPVFGGKVVVQAKRYRNTVGVSAVRDLYGTMLNEGASKGILVTTSGFGKTAYTFANGKPMELLTGENLLYLLKEHAEIDAKIEFPDEWRDPSLEHIDPAG